MTENSTGDLENYRRDSVIDAARALAAKLDEIGAHPSYKGIWGYLHCHNYAYTGPNYERELAELTSAIVNLDRRNSGE